jgi:hypothetical protein
VKFCLVEGMIERGQLVWSGNRLRYPPLAAVHVTVVEDEVYRGIWRVRQPDGTLTDMVNRARARDAARSILVRVLNSRETAAEGSSVRFGAGLSVQTRW